MSDIDPDAFGILCRNLVENALRHGAENAPVDVTLTADGQLIVANDGPVLPRDTLDRLTARFERASASTDGSGLGPRHRRRHRGTDRKPAHPGVAASGHFVRFPGVHQGADRVPRHILSGRFPHLLNLLPHHGMVNQQLQYRRPLPAARPAPRPPSPGTPGCTRRRKGPSQPPSEATIAQPVSQIVPRARATRRLKHPSLRVMYSLMVSGHSASRRSGAGRLGKCRRLSRVSVDATTAPPLGNRDRTGEGQ